MSLAWRGLLLAIATTSLASLLVVACSDEAEEPARAPDGGGDAIADTARDTAPLEATVSDQLVAPPIDGGKAFDFAPPYVATLGPSSRSDAGHATNNVPPSNPAKTLCLTCHKAGAAAANLPFFAGGTVETTGDRSMIEVRLKAFISANAVNAYTDIDGNWFVPAERAADAGVGFSVRPGVRKGATTRTMGSSPAIGNCNQCHGGAIDL